VGFRQLGRRELLGLEPRRRSGNRQVGEGAHHSTTFGTGKQPAATSGALSTLLAAVAVVTSSARRISDISATLVIGSTPSVSTSFSCSASR